MAARNEKHLSTTALARSLGKESKELFILLTGGGWIVKVDNHWQLTEKGKFEGGIYVNHPKYGEYIAWPESVHQHPLFALLPEAPLTASHLGHKLGIPARLVNLVLAERGWLTKHVRGWLLTPAGKLVGGQQHESEQSAIPYASWPESLLDNPRLLASVAQLNGAENSGTENTSDTRTLDGRVVASSAERRVLSWFYLTGIVCAQQYEWFVAGEKITVDFFLPSIQLCIDYWPDNSDAAALAKQLQKQTFYKANKIHFIELRDQDLLQLDEVLAKSLLRHGIAVY